MFQKCKTKQKKKQKYNDLNYDVSTINEKQI